MNCDKMHELMSLYIDNQLDDNEIRDFENHLRECKECTNDFSQLLDIMDEVHSLSHKEVPPDFHRELMDQIIQLVESDTMVTNKKPKWYIRSKWTSSIAAAILILLIVGGAGLNSILNSSRSMKDENASEPRIAQNYDSTGSTDTARENSAPQFAGTTKEAPSLTKLEEEGSMAIQFNEELAKAENEQASMLSDSREAEISGLEKKEAGLGILDNNETTLDHKKIIKSADIHLEIEQFDEIVDKIRTLTEESGGYIENARSSIYYADPDRKEYLKEGYLVLRLPKEQYSVARQRIFDMGHIVNQSENAMNVTQQYMETESRIRMLRVQEQRLMDIMKKAEKVEDLIKLEERLNTVRTELEIYQTNIQNWDQLVAFSTIRVSIRQIKSQEKIETVTPNFLTKIKENMIGSINNLRNAMESFILKIARHFIELIFYGIGLLIILWFLRPFLKKWFPYKKYKK